MSGDQGRVLGEGQRQGEDEEAHCSTVCSSCRELREKIQPEIMELIKQQRLNRLCEGTCFRKISSRRRQGETPASAPPPLHPSTPPPRSGFH